MSKNKILVDALLAYGLSKKESLIYLTLLELGMAPATDVSKVSKINRSSTYVILESLKEKGLVSISEDKNTQQFIASHPDVLLRNADYAVKNKEIAKNKLESIIPELKGLHKGMPRKPKIRVFEGVEGLAEVYADATNMKQNMIRVYSSHQRLFDIFPKSFRERMLDHIKNRVDKKIKMKSIHPDNHVARHIVTNILPKTDNWVLIPENQFEFTADIAIYDDKIGYMSAEGGGYGVVIESKEIANIMKNLFDLAHNEALRISKKYSS